MLPSISNLQKEQFKKTIVQQEIYKIVLKMCSDKIIYTNKNSNQTCVIFEVPQMIIGHPEYNFTECVKYILSELIKEHYLVDFVHPKHLYIDWGSSINENKKSTYPNWVINKSKLKQETTKLLKKYPNAKKIEFISGNPPEKIKKK
jgi:uncharacterized membrane protein